MYYDILVNLIASTISFICGAIVHKAIVKWQEHSKTAIWRLLSNRDNIAICLSVREGPKPSSTARTSIAEVSAVSEIIPILKSLEQNFDLVTDDTDSILRLYKNIISIGGPRANPVTQRLLKQYNNLIPVKILDDPIGFEIGSKQYIPIYSSDKVTLKTDYALLLCIQESTDNRNCKTRIMAIGCRGYGTQGCISCMHSSMMIDLFKKHHKPKSFIALIKVDIDGINLTTHVERFFPLQTI